MRGMRAADRRAVLGPDAVGGVRGVVESVAPGPAVRRRVHRDRPAACTGAHRRVALRPSSRSSSGWSSARPSPRRSPGCSASGSVSSGRGGPATRRTTSPTGCWVNAAYLVGTLVSILVGWPLVGLVMGLFRPEGRCRAPARGGRPSLARRPCAATPVRAGHLAVGRAVRAAPRGPGAALPRRDEVGVARHRQARHGAAADGAGALAQLVAGPWVSSSSSADSSASRAVTNSSSSRPSSVSSGLGAMGRASRTMHASTVSVGHSI